MDIQAIRIVQFGCWEELEVRSITPGLNVFHLDDGGRPIDFARFLHGVLFGFEATSRQTMSGQIVVSHANSRLALNRSNRGPRQELEVTKLGKNSYQDDGLRQLLSNWDEMSERLFLPADEPSSNDHWKWLARNPVVAQQLLRTAERPTSEFLDHASRLSMSSHGDLLEQLGQQREQLLAEIAAGKARIDDQSSHTSATPDRQIVAAELNDELRVVERQLVPLTQAVELVDRWQELQSLSQRKTASADLRKLQALLSEFRVLDAEKQEFQRLLKRRTKRSSGRTGCADEHEIGRLLDQRDWVVEANEQLGEPDALRGTDSNSEAHDEILHAGYLFDSARRDSQKAQGRLADFSKRSNFDWDSLPGDEAVLGPKEISEDSPIAQGPPEQRLEELKRRRLWVREEHRCLLNKQELGSPMLTWVAILFALSVASLFGTLLVVSPVAQWVLVSMGLSGIVSSGAIKLSFELRAARRLNRAKDRIRKIDDEILRLTEQIFDERQDVATARQRAEQKLYALQLQQDVAEANRRLESAETSFRELLDVHGLPITLSPEETSRVLLKRHRPNRGTKGKGNPKLTRWVKQARRVIHRVDGEQPGKDPLELLSLLDLLFDRMRDAQRTKSPSKSSRSLDREQRSDTLRRIRLIEKKQGTILRKANVEDQFALESAVTSAEEQAEVLRRVSSLQLELSAIIESHEDREEIRDLLETFDADDLRVRLSELHRHQDDIKLALKETRDAEAPVSHQKICPAQAELDRARLGLSVIETKIRKAVIAAQTTAVTRRVARSLLTAKETDAPFPFLLELTSGRWASIEPTRHGFVLCDSDGRRVPVESSENALEAWLALRLIAAEMMRSQGDSMPLVLLAEPLMASSNAAAIRNVLRRTADSGQQILVLVGNHQLANQLAEAGEPVARIGLREQTYPRLRDTDFSEGWDTSDRHAEPDNLDMRLLKTSKQRSA